MITLTRPVTRRHTGRHPHACITGGDGSRPVAGGALAVTAIPSALPSGQPYAGMDPCDVLTYVRPWNPVGGMIGYLNFDGAARQSQTPTGGLQRAPQTSGRKRKRGGKHAT